MNNENTGTAIAKKDEVMTKGDTQAMIKHIVQESTKAVQAAIERANPINTGGSKMMSLAEVEGFASIIQAASLYDDQRGQITPATAKAQAMAKIVMGHADGLDPIASQSAYHIINGKLTRGIDAFTAKIKSSGRYDYEVLTLDDKECAIRCFEISKGDWKPISPDIIFTIDDAEAAGLTTGANSHSWKKYRKDMLFARAITRCFKRHFAALNSSQDRRSTEDEQAGVLVSAPAYEIDEPKEAPQTEAVKDVEIDEPDFVEPDDDFNEQDIKLQELRESANEILSGMSEAERNTVLGKREPESMDVAGLITLHQELELA